MLVMKFGGTSVGSGERMLNVARIVIAYHWLKPVVVVSAMAGVTDALLALADAAIAGDATACEAQLMTLRERHIEAAKTIDANGEWPDLYVKLEALRGTVEDALARRDDSAAERDAIISWGEQLSVLLVAGAFRTLGQPAFMWDVPPIVTDDHFGEAIPLSGATRRVAHQALERAGDAILVVPGFIGQTAHGRITTLGRGGSDYSATLLAVAMNAGACWIYTDVDGIFTADPRIVPAAHVLPVVSAAMAGRLSYCGAKVLHPRSVAPAVRHGIELRIRNTFRPEHPGTLIRAISGEQGGQPQAIVGRRELCVIALTGLGLTEIPNLFGRMCNAVTRAGAEIVQSAHPIPGHDPQVIIDATHANRAVKHLLQEFLSERQQGQVTDITQNTGLALCTLVGDDLRSTIFMKAQRALAAERITPLNQSACPDALSFIVPECVLDRAVRRMHRYVIEPQLREVTEHLSHHFTDDQWFVSQYSDQPRHLVVSQH